MNECKFYIGERVRVKPYKDIPRDVPFAFSYEMREYCGKEVEIENISETTWHGSPVWRIFIKREHHREDTYSWAELMLEHIEQINEPDINEWSMIMNDR